MGKFSGYLMVSDLDKTFFAEGTDIPPRNIEAVKYFIENGGKFTLATGRGAVAAKIIAADIPQNAPEILFNGAMLYDMAREEVIEQHGVNTPDMVSLMHSIIEKYPDIMLVVFKDDKMYCISEKCDQRVVEALKNPAVMINVDDLPLPWFKVLCVEKDSVLRELQPFVESFGYPDLRFVRSTPILLEVVGKDNNKGFGLTNLASRLGIDMKKTIIIIVCIVIVILSIFGNKYLNYRDKKRQINEENLEYETYLNKEVSGRDLTTAVNRAVDNNEKNKVSKDEKGFYIQNDINSVIIEIKISDNDTTYKMETLYNGGMPTFIQYYGDISFECTKIDYNKNGRVSFMIFEQKTS